MSNKLHSSKFGPMLCEALGINSTNVRALTIKAEGGEMVRVEVERYLTIDEAGMLRSELEQYELVRHDAGDGVQYSRRDPRTDEVHVVRVPKG